MMSHLDDGVLRRLIDEPFAAADTQRHHLASCEQCRQTQERMRADAAFARSALATSTAPTMPPATALARVHAQVEAQQVRPARRALPWSGNLFRLPRRPAAGAAAVLALAGAVTLTPAGSWAQSFVTLFQPTHVQAIETTAGDLRSLAGLAKYGTIHVNRPGSSVTEPNAAAASTASGMTVLAPGAGIPAGTPTYLYQPGTTGSFTFNAARAERRAARKGETIPPMPAGLNGSTLHVTIGNAVVTEWKGTGTDIPALVIGQMRAPSVTASGVSVAEMENYVLSLPEVPKDVADQIRGISDPNSTLPIPIPVKLASSHAVTVQGVPGVEVGDNTGIGSGVIWEKDGIVYGVAGTMTADQALAVANSLH